MSMPIAIIGIGLRVPGAHTPNDFWELLYDGIDMIRDMPGERLAIESHGNPAARPRKGGFLEDLDQFDPAFFGISPREAAAMDPQQRLLLECVWEAFEDGGIPPSTLAGKPVGVFAGIDSSDYWALQTEASDRAGIHRPDVYGVMGGGARSSSAGRISFAFDLRGPSLSVDAACSSSLAALALACQSLRSGESELALAAGAHIVLRTPETEAFTAAGMLSPDGRCKFGDASADGFVRSDAVGVVLLKPLAPALVAGDPVVAVIAGTGVSNDGRGSGLFMAPAVKGQEQMLRAAYADAGIAPSEVDFVEAHGTGTHAGDPVELEALHRVLSEGRAPGRRVLVGSAKTNIGHPEAAAGIIGLIKAALCVKHRAVPPSLHLARPNPDIPWGDLCLTIPRSPQPLDDDRPLVGGVSSFGISGTNAHVVVTEAGRYTDRPDGVLPVPTGGRHRDAALAEGGADGNEQMLTLSARSAEALREMVRFYLAFLGTHGRGSALADICHTAAARRDHHGYRLAVAGSTHDAITAQLRTALHSAEAPRRARPHRVAFVFPGQGSQWVGMGRDLLASSPAFRAALQHCDDAVRAEAGWSVVEKLHGDEADWSGIDVIQPLLWAVEVALAETWRAWGVTPDLVLGHSMGEVAAACVAGALTIEQGAAVICRRSGFMRRCAGRGAMAVAELNAVEAGEAIAEFRDRISIAAVNSPRSVVLSGDVSAVTELTERLDAQGVFCRLVKVDVASHSSHMDPFLDPLAESLDDLRPSSGVVDFRSTVVGGPIDTARLDADYWARNLREPVLFRQVVAQAAAEADTVFVEISPHPVLSHAVEESIAEGASVTSLRRDQPERTTLLGSLTRLYELDVSIDWSGLYGSGQCVPLPHYPWQRERHWFDNGERSPAPSDLGYWESRLDPGAMPYLLDHRVHGMPLAPGTVFLDAVQAAVAEALGGGSADDVALTEVVFTDALLMSEPVTLRVALDPTANASWLFEVAARADGCTEWTTCCTGVALSEQRPREEHELPSAIRGRCSRQWSPDEFYGYAAQAGSVWGEHMRPVTDVWIGDGEALARVGPPADSTIAAATDRPLHPALLEACAQPLVALLGASVVAEAIDHARVGPADPVVWSHVRLRPASTSPALALADVTAMDESGVVVAQLNGIHIRPMQNAGGVDSAPRGDVVEALPPHGQAATRIPSSGTQLSCELHLSDQRQPDTTGQLSATLRISVSVGGTTSVDLSSGDPVSVGESVGAPQPAPAPRGVLTSAPPRAAAPQLSAPTRHAAPPQRSRGAAPAPVSPVSSVPPAPAVAVPVLGMPDAGARPVPGEAASSEQIHGYLLDAVTAILRISGSQIDVERAPRELGMDSIMALELRNRIQQDLDVSVSTSSLLQARSLADLADELAAKAAGR